MSELSNRFKDRKQEEDIRMAKAEDVAEKKQQRTVGRYTRVALGASLVAVLIATPLVLSAIAGENAEPEEPDVEVTSAVIEDEDAEQTTSEFMVSSEGFYTSEESTAQNLGDIGRDGFVTNEWDKVDDGGIHVSVSNDSRDNGLFRTEPTVKSDYTGVLKNNPELSRMTVFIGDKQVLGFKPSCDQYKLHFGSHEEFDAIGQILKEKGVSVYNIPAGWSVESDTNVTDDVSVDAHGNQTFTRTFRFAVKDLRATYWYTLKETFTQNNMTVTPTKSEPTQDDSSQGEGPMSDEQPSQDTREIYPKVSPVADGFNEGTGAIQRVFHAPSPIVVFKGDCGKVTAQVSDPNIKVETREEDGKISVYATPVAGNYKGKNSCSAHVTVDVPGVAYKYMGYHNEWDVTWEKVPVNIAVTKPAAITEGGTVQIKASATPAAKPGTPDLTAYKNNLNKFTYGSLDTAIATVNATSGVVTGRKAGIGVITVTRAADDVFASATATVNVEVKAKPAPTPAPDSSKTPASTATSTKSPAISNTPVASNSGSGDRSKVNGGMSFATEAKPQPQPQPQPLSTSHVSPYFRGRANNMKGIPVGSFTDVPEVHFKVTMQRPIDGWSDAGYEAHTQGLGSPMANMYLGKPGIANGIETIQLGTFNHEQTKFTEGASIEVHQQGVGWIGGFYHGGVYGEPGSRLEAIKLKLDDALAAKYDIWYRAHCQSYGWMAWAKNGAPAGTTGQAKRMEAVQVVLTRKGAGAPGKNFGNAQQNYGQAFVS